MLTGASKPGDFVAAAFVAARFRLSELSQTWVKLSHRVGSALPAAKLIMSIQRLGELDILLRCMEDDFDPKAAPTDLKMMADNSQVLLSESWVGAAFSILEALRKRKIGPQGDELQTLHQHFRLIRVPLEKFEIAGDRKLGEPLEMRRRPAKGDESDRYVYDKTDPTRAHIMGTGLTSRGSVMWRVVDLPADSEYWLERRELSDRLITLWGRATGEQPSSSAGE